LPSSRRRGMLVGMAKPLIGFSLQRRARQRELGQVPNFVAAIGLTSSRAELPLSIPSTSQRQTTELVDLLVGKSTRETVDSVDPRSRRVSAPPQAQSRRKPPYVTGTCRVDAVPVLSFNGDLGVVEKINRIEQVMTVNIEGRPVEYDFGDLGDTPTPMPAA
jgi:hypothetical protein